MKLPEPRGVYQARILARKYDITLEQARALKRGEDVAVDLTGPADDAAPIETEEEADNVSDQ